MSDASLTVKMALDRLAMKQGLEGATNDAKNFKDSFERSMRDTKGAVKDVAGSIDGIGRAFDGSIQGAVGGFKDLVGLMQAAPWAAIATAVAGIGTAAVKAWEESENAMAAYIDKVSKASVSARKEAQIAGGKLTTEQVEKKFISEESPSQIRARLDGLKKMQADIQSQIISGERSLAGSKEAGVPAWVERDAKVLMELYKSKEENAKKIQVLNDGLADKELKAEQRRVEKMNERTRESIEADKKAAKQKEQIEKEKAQRIKVMDDEREREMEARAKAEEDIAGLFKKREGTPDFSRGVDIYQRLGGSVGANLDVGRLSRQTESEKIQAEIKEINKTMEAHLEKIRQAATLQMDEIKRSQDSEAF